MTSPAGLRTEAKHRLARRFRPGVRGRAAASGAEGGGEDVAGGAGGGRDVGDGGQPGHPLAGLAQVTGVIRRNAEPPGSARPRCPWPASPGVGRPDHHADDAA